MQRSIKLGYCICNPKQACPCPTFKEKDICRCAGERIEQAIEGVKLTALVEKAGCASKINQNDLKNVLAGLPEISDPRVLVGTNTCDDAGVYKLNDETALVQTVDVFSPTVDDAYTFGQIAAANSLSDIYAMGGHPLTALSVIGFPIETLSPRIMTQMLRGGMDKMTEAGVVIIGGHSINDENPKFGYAVTGTVDVSRIVTNDRAKPGDSLILTKPLGVGIISFAGQVGKASESALASAARSMTELNKTAAEVMVEFGVNAATDVTGFGLLGHLKEMVDQSGVAAEIYSCHVPVFDEALDYVGQGIISGGIERNMEHSSECVTIAEDVSEEIIPVLYDPQTSGGLLISVPGEKADALISRLKERGIEHASIIGRITSEHTGRITVIGRPDTLVGQDRTGVSDLPGEKEYKIMPETSTECCCSQTQTECCTTATENAGQSEERFSAFMKEVNADGAISIKTKELIAIALSLLAKCEPCVKIHIDKARSLGVTQSEIDEAVWMAISFGGAPIKMFYDSVKI